MLFRSKPQRATVQGTPRAARQKIPKGQPRERKAIRRRGLAGLQKGIRQKEAKGTQKGIRQKEAKGTQKGKGRNTLQTACQRLCPRAGLRLRKKGRLF